MALIQCPECGKTVSSRAAYCPECGHPIKNNNKRKIVIFSIVVAIIAVIAVGAFFLLNIDNKPATISEEIQIQITPKFSEAIRQYDELTPFSEGMAWLFFTSPSPRDRLKVRMPSFACKIKTTLI